MESVELIKGRRDRLINELNELGNLPIPNQEPQSMGDCKAKRDLANFGIPMFACKYCKLDCGSTGYRCNHFVHYYDQEKVLFQGDHFDINPIYEQKVKEEIVKLTNKIAEYEDSSI